MENLTDHDLLINSIAEQKALGKKLEAVCTATHETNARFDAFFAPDGPFMKVKLFQAACPRFDLRLSIKRIWAVIGLIATVICGVIIRVIK